MINNADHFIKVLNIVVRHFYFVGFLLKLID